MAGNPNSLMTLNGYLFEQLDRLNDTSVTGDDLKQEIDRARAVTETAQAIVANANTIIKAANMQGTMGAATGRQLTGAIDAAR